MCKQPATRTEARLSLQESPLAQKFEKMMRTHPIWLQTADIGYGRQNKVVTT